MKFLQEIRQRQVIPLAGLYVVGAWVVIEVSSVFFPAWDIPDTALRYLFVAAAALFPVVLLFGWFFDVRRDGLFRTVKTDTGEIRAAPLGRGDYAVLGTLTAFSGAILLLALLQVWKSVDASPDSVTATAERIENSIAVLPFTNLDPNPDTGFFSDGVSEEILHRLSATRALHVLGWASAKILGQSEVSPAEISERLGVEYLLHGSIRRDGDYVRVTARLMDRAGLQVWSQSFDRKLESIFVIQSEIASAVTSQIVAEIVSSDGQSTRPATYNMDAYNEYLVGRALTHARGPEWDVKSEAAFRRAIELDPAFAPAHAGLAYSLFIMSTPTEERIQAALSAAERSLELDPNLALGHAMLGVMQFGLGLASPAEAEQNLRRALELDPALSDAYNWLSINLGRQGRLAERDVIWEQAYQIDPLHPSIAGNYANERANHGDFERAMRMLEPFTRLPQMGGAVFSALVTVNAEYGRFAEAIGVYDGSRSSPYWAALGLQEQADKLLAQIQNPYVQALALREVLATRGEHQQTWQFIERYMNEFGYEYEMVDPNDQAWILETQALAGDYDGVIDRFEDAADGDALAWIENVDGMIVADLLNAVGYAYLQSGDIDNATRVLSLEPQRLAHYKPFSSPLLLATMALNAALRGDDDLAYSRLSLAVDKGWADYYAAINDPRWGDVLLQARFVKLMENVKADIDAQRAQAEAMLRDDD